MIVFLLGYAVLSTLLTAAVWLLAVRTLRHRDARIANLVSLVTRTGGAEVCCPRCGRVFLPTAPNPPIPTPRWKPRR